MTAIVPTINRMTNHATVEWTLTGGQVGQAIQMEGWHLRSIAISGTIGAAITILCANDENATQSVGLKGDRTANAISTTSAAMFGTPDNVNWLWPSAAAGTTNCLIAAFYERTR